MPDEFKCGDNVTIIVNQKPGRVEGVYHRRVGPTQYSVQYLTHQGEAVQGWFNPDELVKGSIPS